MDNGRYSQLQIRAVVDDGGGVAGADTQSGLAGGIGGFHHTGAAGGKGQVTFPHNQIAQFQTGYIDPADDPLGSAGCDSGFQNNSGGFDGAFFCSGVRADDHAVSGFQGNEGLENGGGSGIGGGDDRSDHTDGFGDLLNTVGSVFFNDTAGLLILVGIVNIFSGIVVLDHLVFHDAHAGFGNGHFRQRNTGAVGGGSGGKEDAVHICLRKLGKALLRGTDTGNDSLKFFSIGDSRIFVFHNDPPFRNKFIGVYLPIYYYRYNSTE